MKENRYAFLLIILLLSSGTWLYGQSCAGIQAPPTTCAGVDVIVRADGPTPASYSWTLPPGVTLVSGTLSSSTITIRWNNGGPGTSNPYNSTITCNYNGSACQLLLSKTIAIKKQPGVTLSAPTSQSVCLNAPTQAISVTASGTSPFTYQWFSNTTNSNIGGTLISGATSSSFTPPSSATMFYFANVTGTGSCSTKSAVASVIINNPPTIITQPTPTQSVCVNGNATLLSVSVTGPGHTFQWFNNTINSNTGGTSISGATSSSFAPPSSTAGTKFYYVIVTRSGCSITSNVASVSVFGPPTITAQPSPSTQSICLNATSQVLSVSGSGSNLTYQWFSNTSNSNSGGTLINGATNPNFSPPSTISGTKYYYVTIAGAGGGTCQVTSNPATVTVINPPTITVHPTPSQTVCPNTPAMTLSVTANGTSLTYQWYSNATNSNTGGTLISGATSSSFSPPASATTTYYYLVVTGVGLCNTISNASAIIVGTCAEALSFNGDGTLFGNPSVVTIPNSDGRLNLGTSDFTIELFFKLTANPGLFSAILSNRTNGNTPGADGFLIFFTGSNGTPMIQLQDTPNIQPAINNFNLFDGNCHHLAIRRSGTTISFFVDGVFKSNGNAASVNRNVNSTGPLRMGGDAINIPFPGWIGEVRIWNIALSDTQIQNNVGSNLSPQSGLLAYYDMKDPIGSQILTDRSATNGSNGVLGTITSSESIDPLWLTPEQVTCSVSGNFRMRSSEHINVKIDSAKDVSNDTRLFPNPSEKFISIDLPEAVNQSSTIHLFDSHGTETMRELIEKGESQKTIYVGDLPDGIYILSLRTSQFSIKKKVIIFNE